MNEARHSDIRANYVIHEELGHGAYGTVRRAQKKIGAGSLSYQYYAIKQIDKHRAGQKGLRTVYGEVETLMLLNHPNIVRMDDVFQDADNLWIVMEYLSGGELGHLLKVAHKANTAPPTSAPQRGFFIEANVRKMVLYLLFALQYLHERGFVHRDLKPANCLLSNEGEPLLKIADFGFAVLAGSDESLRCYCGTVAYMAPEILLNLPYGKPVDMWALGVIVYQLLSLGTLPFCESPQGGGRVSLEDAIMAGEYSFDEPIWRDVSPGAKSFIRQLLERDPAKRASATACMTHPWLQSAMTSNVNLSPISPGKSRRKNPRVLFRGAVLLILAAHRLLFWCRCNTLLQEGAHSPILRSFSYLVGGRYRPAKVATCGGMFLHQTKSLFTYLKMLEVATTVEVLDLSNNGIDNTDMLQMILKAVTGHPSLQVLVLDDNPLPALAGRALLRFTRVPSRFRQISLNNTSLGSDVISQVNKQLKETDRRGGLGSGGSNQGSGNIPSLSSIMGGLRSNANTPSPLPSPHLRPNSQPTSTCSNASSASSWSRHPTPLGGRQYLNPNVAVTTVSSRGPSSSSAAGARRQAPSTGKLPPLPGNTATLSRRH